MAGVTYKMWIGRSDEAFCHLARLLACSHNHTPESHAYRISYCLLSFSLSLIYRLHTRPQPNSTQGYITYKCDSVEDPIDEMLWIPIFLSCLFRASSLPQILQQSPFNSTHLDPIQQVGSHKWPTI